MRKGHDDVTTSRLALIISRRDIKITSTDWTGMTFFLTLGCVSIQTSVTVAPLVLLAVLHRSHIGLPHPLANTRRVSQHGVTQWQAIVQ